MPDSQGNVQDVVLGFDDMKSLTVSQACNIAGEHMAISPGCHGVCMTGEEQPFLWSGGGPLC